MWRSHAKRKAERVLGKCGYSLSAIGSFWWTIHGKKFSRFYGSDSRLWFAVVVIGIIEGYVLLPVGLASFLGAFFLIALVVWRVAVNYWLRRDSSVVQFNPTSNLASLSSTNLV